MCEPGYDTTEFDAELDDEDDHPPAGRPGEGRNSTRAPYPLG